MRKTFKIELGLDDIELEGSQTFKQVLWEDLEALDYFVHSIEEVVKDDA